MSTLLFSTIFSHNQICPHRFFFFFFINHRQLLQSLVKDKHPFLKKKNLQECIYILDFKGKQKYNVRLGHFHYRV